MFLIIDKPKGWTSFDVVAKMRGILGERKIGHLGTLDPLATGVLVLAVGRESTKKIPEYMKAEKDYQVEIELGKFSNTYDLEGEIKETGVKIPSVKKIKEVILSFQGESMQRPPAFSAKKIKGKRAYELARKGQEVVLKPVKVQIEITDIKIKSPFINFSAKVSSGTYIRSLAHDIGEKLACGGLLTSLKRTRVGDFKIEDAKKIEDFI